MRASDATLELCASCSESPRPSLIPEQEVFDMIVWSGPTQPTGPVIPMTDPTPPGVLLSDEPTIELVVRARAGDRNAVEALLQRCLPSLRRWAHGRLPSAARGAFDTEDIVQDAALHALRRLDVFEPRH